MGGSVRTFLGLMLLCSLSQIKIKISNLLISACVCVCSLCSLRAGLISNLPNIIHSLKLLLQIYLDKYIFKKKYKKNTDRIYNVHTHHLICIYSSTGYLAIFFSAVPFSYCSYLHCTYSPLALYIHPSYCTYSCLHI